MLHAAVSHQAAEGFTRSEAFAADLIARAGGDALSHATQGRCEPMTSLRRGSQHPDASRIHRPCTTGARRRDDRKETAHRQARTQPPPVPLPVIVDVSSSKQAAAV